MIGRTIAHYQITAKIGEGGMGEVYRATDTKLKREVALKILPESFAADPHRMGRFRREAEVLASLNHPNIAGIYGLEKEVDTHAIAMELVEGETLAARIKQGPIPLEEALQIALQIASALEAAHERGIIHRDLKPANVVVSAEGGAKVLDFGLAKATEQEPGETPDLTQSPTLTMQATQAGLILGTAAYMAPEQAKGRPVDKRADNWAFGVVLFEMLTGGSVFSGDDITEVLAAVVMTDPDWDRLPPAVPATIRKLLRRCLRRDTRSRLRDIGDARISIEEVLTDPAAGAALPAPLKLPAWKAPAVWALVVTAMVLAGVAAWFLKPVPAGTRIKYTITEDQFQPDEAPPVLSPDGKMLAYRVADQLRIRYLDSLESYPLPGSEQASSPFFSPDSRFLGYAQAGKLWKVELSASAKSAVCDLPAATVEGAQTQTLRFRGATWGGSGLIVFGTTYGLYQVSERGGDPQLLLEPDSDTGEGWLESPSFLPDEKGILFVARAAGPESIHLLVGDTRKLVLAQNDADLWTPVYAPSGHLIYRRNQSNRGLYAIPFSLSSLTTSGSPILIDAAGHSPSVSNNQILSYAIGGIGSHRELVRVDRTGQVADSIGQVSTLAQPALSPDGELVAVSSFEEGHADIWIHDFRRSKTRLTSSGSNEWRPAWMPTGDQVVFERDEELWLGTLDNRAPERRLTIGAEPNLSADGRFLVFRRTAEGTGSDLWYLEMNQEGDAKPFLVLDSNESNPRLSSDGRWLAYVSDQAGESQIYVKQFPSGEGLWPISNDGGTQPRWSPNGDELFYAQERNLMVVAIQQVSDGLRAGAPEKVFELPGSALWGFSVGEGGESFILVRPAVSGGVLPSLTVVHNWFSEFRESPASGR